MAVLFITHDVGVVANRALVLRHGKTEEVARVADLFEAVPELTSKLG